MRTPAPRLARALGGSLWVWLLAVWLAWLAMPAGAQGVPAPRDARPPLLLLDDMRGSIEAEDAGQYWLDKVGNATLEQVLRPGLAQFAPMSAGRIYAPGETGALWLHFRVEQARSQKQAWLIEFPIPVLDLVTIWQQDERGQWQSQTAGDTLAVDRWPEAGRYAFFRLDLRPGQPRDIYVRIRHTTPISIPVKFSPQSVHDQRIQVEYMGLGMAYGALLLLIAACIAQAWVYRDAVYAWYSAYASIMTLAVASYTGVAGHLLWSGFSYWTDASQGVLAILAGAAALLFVRDLTGISARHRVLNRVVQWGGWAGFGLAVLFMTVSKTIGLAVVGVYIAFASVMNLWVAWLAWRRHDVVGLWVLAAYVPLGLAVLAVVLRIFGLLPISFGTQYAVVVASAIEVPLLLVALSIRSRERHGAQIREQALSSQDALTGLLASHLFHDRLRQVVSRYRREQQHAAVVFIDLVNYQPIKNFYGTSVAEQSLLRCVIKLRRLLRDVDTVSRIGESRFALILEGVTSRATVTDRAARLIAAGLMPLAGLKPDVTLQFHVAAVLLSERVMDAPELTHALGDLLAGMSPRTRRPIRFLEPEATRPADLAGDPLQEDSTLPRALDEHPAQSNA